MRYLLLSTAFVLLPILPVHAQNIAQVFSAEIRATSAERHARYAVNGASAEVIALIGQMVGEGHAGVWGGWMGNEFIYYNDWYDTAAATMDRWNAALLWEDLDPDTAETVLTTAMHRFRAMDAELEDRIAAAYWQVHLRAHHFSEAIRIGSQGENCVAYHYHMDQSQMAWNRAYATLPNEMRYAEVIPPVDGFIDTELALRELMPGDDATLAQLPHSFATMRLLLANHGVPEDDAILLALDMLGDHAAAQGHADNAVSLLQRHAAAEDGRLHRAFQAQMELLDRAAAVVPGMVAALGGLDRPLTADDIRPLYEVVVRADQLRSDVQNPFSQATGFSRTLSGLRAVVGAMQIAEGDADAHQYLDVIQDAARAASRGPSVVSPNATAAGIYAGHVNWQADSLNAISQTMDAVAQAIRTGDARDVQRAIALSENVRRQIHPHRIAQHWIHGAADSFVRYVPFGRTFLGELVDTLAPMEEDEPSEEDVDDFTGRCY